MKKIIFTCLVNLAIFSNIFSAESITDFISTLNLFFPAEENSKNEASLIKFIEEFCLENNFIYKRYKLSENNPTGSSENIEIYIKGSSVDREKIILFCSLNPPVINQNSFDNSISIAITLFLIKELKKISFKKDLIFVFSGGNENEYNLNNGLKLFLDKLSDKNKAIFIALDLFNIKSKIKFTGSNIKKSIPLEILKVFFKIKGKYYNFLYFERNEIYRSRILFQHSDPYLKEPFNENIISVSFTNRNFITESKDKNKFTERDLIEFINFLFHFYLALDDVVVSYKLDYNYLYLNIFKYNIIIPEYLLVIIYLSFFLAFLLLKFFFPNFQRMHFFFFLKLLPYITFLFIFFFLFSLVPLAVFYFFEFIFAATPLYSNSLIIYLLNIFIFPFICLILLFDFFKKYQFPLHSYVYTYGFTILSFINLLLSMFFDFSLIPVFLIPVILVTLSHYFKKINLLSAILQIIATFPYIIVIYDLSYLNSAFFLEKIPPLQLNLFFLVFIFPLSLNFFSLFLKYFVYLNKRWIFALLILLPIISSFILLYFENNSKKQVTIYSTHINYLKENFSFINLKSNVTLGKILFDYSFKKEKLLIRSKQKNIVVLPLHPCYSLVKEVRDNYYNFFINSELPIKFIESYLVCPKGLYPIESNISYSIVDMVDSVFLDNSINMSSNDYDVYSFDISPNSGNSFFLKLYLLPAKYKIIFKLTYPFFLSNYNLYKKNAYIVKNTIFIEEFDLK